MKKFLSDFGLEITLLIAGLAGSLIHVTRKQNPDIYKSFASIISGTFSANYITPLICDNFHITGKSQFTVAFMIGLIGLKGVEKLFEKYISAKWKSDK